MKKILSFLFILILSSSPVLADNDPFSSPTVVYVIASGSNLNHVREVVDNTVRLSAKVPIRSFTLVQKLSEISATATDDKESSIKSYDSAISPIKQLGLEETSTDSSLTTVKELRLSYSPTWIVKANGREYVYEGYQDISKFFTRDGIFLNKIEGTSETENLGNIALHEKRSTSINFPLTSEKQTTENLNIGIIFKPGANDPYPDLDDKVENFIALPKCITAKTELDEVFHDTPGSESLDTIIYDPRIMKEQKLASSQKVATIPWDPNYDTSAGHESADAKLQDLARVLNPRCLPARFSFTYSGSKRYQKIQYGDKAWE